MPALDIPPALSQILRLQARGRLRRLGQCCATPRRLALTLSAAVLSCIWLGNVALSILFRESYAVDSIRTWVRVGLTVYAVWHLVRTAWERPQQSLVWSPAEEEFLVAGPFTRRNLVQYRLLVICCSAVFKASFATLLLLPDLAAPWLGLLGLCLGLTCVEFLRVGIDTLTAAMDRREYAAYRSIVLSLSGLAVVWGLLHAVDHYTAALVADRSMPEIIALISACIRSVQALSETGAFLVLSFPFDFFAQIVVCAEPTPLVAGQVLAAALGSWLLMEAVLWMDGRCQARRQMQDAADLALARRAAEEAAEVTSGRLPRVLLSPVTWRQLRGARLNLSGVLLALVAPAMLSLLPFLMISQRPQSAFGNFAASLAFYTFLLLPPALKFDFRRDYDRLLALKMLPVSAWRLTLGQVAAPVLIATVFQWTMILAAYVARPVELPYVLAALALFVPANLVVFGLDNLLFLLFPHRLHQEGIDVFLRTTLVFTAKGVVFAIALAGVLLWSVAARSLAEALASAGVTWLGPVTVFGGGLWGLTMVAAVVAIGLASRAFLHFDPSRGAVT
jgi:hypothetical protein